MYVRCDGIWTARRLRATRARRNDWCEWCLCLCASTFLVIPSSVFVLLCYASSEVSSGFGSGAASWKTPFAGGGFGVDPGGHMRRMLVAFSGMQ